MTRSRLQRVAALGAALLLHGCGGGASGPSLTMPTADTHAVLFPIAPGDVHGPAVGQASVDCNACHYDKANAQPSATFLQYSCTGCHVPLAGGQAWHDDQGVGAGQVTLAALHSSAPDFAAKVAALGLSGACLGCHPAGTVGVPTDHAAYFSLAADGPHVYPGARIRACGDCHASSNRLDPAAFRCATCHAADTLPLATGHAGIPDFAAAPQDPVKCLACHADGRRPRSATNVVVTVASHATVAQGFTIGAGSHAGAAGGACLACHPASRAPSAAAPHWDYARDWKQVACTGCHVAVAGGAAFHDDAASLQTLHTSTHQVSTYAATVASRGLSAACLSCHADGAGGAPANHPQLFPIAAGTAHAGIACGACHGSANRQDRTALACASCHAALPGRPTMAQAHTISGYLISGTLTASTAGGATTRVNIDLTKPDGCLSCHGDGQVSRVASHPGGESAFGKGQHRAGGCLTCHWRPRADKTWSIDFGSASGTAGPPPKGCYVCHANGTGNN